MLSKAAQAVCVASLCLAAMTTTTTTTDAFLVPSLSLKSAAVARSHQQRRAGAACARCNFGRVQSCRAATITMVGDLDSSNSNNTHTTNKLAALRNRLRSRGRGRSRGGADNEAAAREGQLSFRAMVNRRAKAVMHKSVLAAAAAMIVRASFNPQAASAVGYKPRSGGATSSRQLEEKKLERARQEVVKEQQQMLDAATSDLNGEITEEQAAATSAAMGEVGEQAGGDEATAAAGSRTLAKPAVDDLAERIRSLPTPEQQERALSQCNADVYKQVWQKLTTSQKTAITKLQIENKSYLAVSIGDYRKAGKQDFAPAAIIFSGFLFVTGMRSSLKIMAKQRKRVRAEAAKFDMERDEFMNVDGEAEFDVDIMKELRDMKEKMAGPGDKYAKDTRAYNPEFAAAAGDEEEYDKKIREALKGTGKGGRTKKGETRKVFTNTNTKGETVKPGSPASKDSADGDDLLGGVGDGAGAADKTKMDQADDDAKAAAQAKRAAAAKRLEDLFNNSSIDDPEDDRGDNRELLP